MRILEAFIQKSIAISQKINDDVAFSVGGIGGGVYSYFTHIKIIELFDFSVHALLGGLISYGLKHGFEFLFKRKVESKNEQNS